MALIMKTLASIGTSYFCLSAVHSGSARNAANLLTPVHTGRDYTTDPTTVKGINPLGDATSVEHRVPGLDGRRLIARGSQ